jgi:hypothetical protein
MTGCASAELMIRYLRYLHLIVLVLSCTRGHAQNSRPTSTPRNPQKPVLKAKVPIQVMGTVIAHNTNRGTWVGDIHGGYLDVVIIRVDKELNGPASGKFVRADFLGGPGQNLPSSLFEGRPWRIRLDPPKPRHFVTCDWTIPPTPPPGDLMREFNFFPDLKPVGGAKSFPDVNALYCYVLEIENLRDLRSTSLQ